MVLTLLFIHNVEIFLVGGIPLCFVGRGVFDEFDGVGDDLAHLPDVVDHAGGLACIMMLPRAVHSCGPARTVAPVELAVNWLRYLLSEPPPMMWSTSRRKGANSWSQVKT